MPLERRAVLAGVATVAGALAGCSGDGPDQTPETVPDPESETIGGDDPADGGDDPPDEARETAHYVFTPDIEDWEADRTGDGQLRLRVDMRNVDPDPIEGQLEAEFRINGSLQRYNASFSLPADESATVTVTYPVPHDTIREGGYLRLRVPVVNETD